MHRCNWLIVWPIWPKFLGITKNLGRNTKKFGFSFSHSGFLVLDFFWDQNMRSPITLEPAVHLICNLSGLCSLLMSIMWQCVNFKFLSLCGPMGMGQFWAPESAVGHKWSNFQRFGFKFGLYSLLLRISTLKTKKFHIA